MFHRFALICLSLLLACGCTGAPAASQGSAADDDTTQTGKATTESTYKSDHLGADILVLPGVFNPQEAEFLVLPLMKENAVLFAGKRVLEIGSGSGIVSAYAAKLGAKEVVATDISPAAVDATKRNAERLGFGSVVDARLVSKDDISAFSAIGDDERFDVIISNPPYSLDLDADGNDAVTDAGDLGFSIVRGLDRHLTPDGKALLLYRSLFYQLTMVKFARYNGFDVRFHRALSLTSWESEALFNSYLNRLLEHENVDPDAFRFSNKDPGGIGTFNDPKTVAAKPLLPGNSNRYYDGWIVIERFPEA